MLSPTYLTGVAENVVEIYARVEANIMADIARRIVKAGYITATARWQIEKAKIFTDHVGKIDKLLADATGKSEAEIRRLMAEAGVTALEYDDRIYLKAGKKPTPIKESPLLNGIILQGTDNTLALVGKYTKTTSITSVTALNNALDRAYLQIMSGAFSKDVAIKTAVNDLARRGITKMAYPSGEKASLESGVRRAVLTGVNQTAGKLQIARMDEMKCELVETSSHPGARPEHAEWQGKVFALHGSHDGYENFYEATGYGTGPGLCGWNCYHSFYPFFKGASQRIASEDPSKDAGSTNDKDYENMQKQRYYERRIREAKKEQYTLDEARKATNDPDLKESLGKDADKAQQKVRDRQRSMREFLNETGGRRHYDREWTAGYNK